MTDAAALIVLALRALDGAADLGDGTARNAARLLRGTAQRRGGRPCLDDAALLAEIEQLGGGADAIAAVAGGNANIRKRLRRKCQNQFMAEHEAPI
jgi:hypothetical protein